MGELVNRSHLQKMLKVCLVLSLLLCLGLPAPSGLVRIRRQLAPPGPSLGFLSNSTSAAGGTTSLGASNTFSSSSRTFPWFSQQFNLCCWWYDITWSEQHVLLLFQDLPLVFSAIQPLLLVVRHHLERATRSPPLPLSHEDNLEDDLTDEQIVEEEDAHQDGPVKQTLLRLMTRKYFPYMSFSSLD